MMYPKHFVVSVNRMQFLDWCRQNMVNPYDARQVREVRFSRDLRGYQRVDPDRIIFLPGASSLVNYEDIVDAVRAMTSKAKA